MPLSDQCKKIVDLLQNGRLVSAIRFLCTKVWYRHSVPLPSCKVESLDTRIVNTHVFIYRLWCLHGNIVAHYFSHFLHISVISGGSKFG